MNRQNIYSFISENIWSNEIEHETIRVGTVGLYVETFLADGTAENEFYLRDFEDNIKTENSNNGYVTPEEYQNEMFIQNISPYYINNTANLNGLSKKSPTNSPVQTTLIGMHIQVIK